MFGNAEETRLKFVAQSKWRHPSNDGDPSLRIVLTVSREPSSERLAMHNQSRKPGCDDFLVV